MEQEKKIYVVTSGYYSDKTVVAVYENKKDAELYCKKYVDSEIEEFNLNAPLPEKVSYSVRFNIDKKIDYVTNEYAISDYEFVDYCQRNIHLNIFAKDLNHAEKKASDELMMITANQLTHFPLLYTKCVKRFYYHSNDYELQYPRYDIRTFEIVLNKNEELAELYNATIRRSEN